MAEAAITAPTNRRRVNTSARSVLRHDDVGRLDDRPGRIAFAKPELVHRLHRDRRRDDRAAPHIDLHVGGRRPTDDLHGTSFEHIACAELHRPPLRGTATTVPGPSAICSTCPDTCPSMVLKCMCRSESPGVKMPRCRLE